MLPFISSILNQNSTPLTFSTHIPMGLVDTVLTNNGSKLNEIQ